MREMPEDFQNGIRVHDAITCPQCGAPIVNDKCSYCGAYFYDFGCIDTEKPFFMKIKHKDQIHMYKVRMDTTEIKYSNNDIQFWGDNALYTCVSSPEIDIDLHFHVVD